ncbi:MAG: hypothetical protein NTW87_33880 [Planctomycetota bacterium]|nr:hypothetical protein [Planctomycetota bacterium]
MPVRLKCPSCSLVQEMPETAAGTVAECTACKARIPLPVRKVCCKCGKDVSRARRTKDQFGRYYCAACLEKLPVAPAASAAAAPAPAPVPAAAAVPPPLPPAEPARAPLPPAPTVPAPPPPPPDHAAQRLAPAVAGNVITYFRKLLGRYLRADKIARLKHMPRTRVFWLSCIGVAAGVAVISYVLLSPERTDGTFKGQLKALVAQERALEKQYTNSAVPLTEQGDKTGDYQPAARVLGEVVEKTDKLAADIAALVATVPGTPQQEYLEAWLAVTHARAAYCRQMQRVCLGQAASDTLKPLADDFDRLLGRLHALAASVPR